MNLTAVFGKETRTDFVSWLMSEEGRNHVDQVFAPADTDLSQYNRNDGKFGRCVWMSQCVLSRRATKELLKMVFIDPPYHGYEKEYLSEYIDELDNPVKWKDVDINEVLAFDGLWK